jgi:phosphoglycolate phosphatase-like HAD superfamily hydrolase
VSRSTGASFFARAGRSAPLGSAVYVKRLILWDIDGTLIASGGAGLRALQRGLLDAFGVEGSLADIDFGGRTDTWIMREVFRKFGLVESPENFGRFFEAYLARLPAELANAHARVLPGVREILRAVADHGAIAQGLLTGNMRRGAQAKLAHHGLWEYFAFGAFADDSEHRNELGPHAVRRALERHGVHFPGDDVWIVGDTIHDIACGKAIGARTLAVGTGGVSLEKLRAHQPSAVLPDLSDTAAVLRLLES